MNLAFTRTLEQTKIQVQIAKSIEGDRIPQSMLIFGPKGGGQAAMMLDLADILLCNSTDRRPCEQCPRCLERKRRNAGNLLVVAPRAAGKEEDEVDWTLEDPYRIAFTRRENISIEQIRQLKIRLGFSESAQRRRVVLLFGVESLLDVAGNSLLKILEEPPPRVHFILGTDNLSRVLPTIVSRCLSLGLSPLSLEGLKQYADKRMSTMEWNPQVAAVSQGSPGVYFNLMEGAGVELLKDAMVFLRASLLGGEEGFENGLAECGAIAENSQEKCIQLIDVVLEWTRQWQRGGLQGHAVEKIFPNTGLSSGEWTEFCQFLQEARRSIFHYVKPTTAFITHYLQWTNRVDSHHKILT